MSEIVYALVRIIEQPPIDTRSEPENHVASFGTPPYGKSWSGQTSGAILTRECYRSSFYGMKPLRLEASGE